jgi:hypothetical protein
MNGVHVPRGVDTNTGGVPELPSLAQFVRQLGTGRGRASAGAATGLAVAISADLIAQVAERSPGWEGRAGALAQADVLRDRAIAAARDVAVVYDQLVTAMDAAVGRSGSAPLDTSGELGQRLALAVDLLLRLAESAADSAALAADVAAHGDLVVRADATAAAALAAGAAEIAAHLIEVNLLASTQPEPVARARQLVSASASSRVRALAVAT